MSTLRIDYICFSLLENPEIPSKNYARSVKVNNHNHANSVIHVYTSSSRVIYEIDETGVLK